MAEHTKTPWKIAGAVHIYSPGEGGGNVCSMSDPRVSTVVGYTDVALDSKDADEAYANAAFIVRCVNAHDDLVSALMMCRTYLSELAENDKYARDDFELVSDLLKRVSP
jgi:hypothetical protein